LPPIFISGRDLLFTHRIEEGCIVDGHGDLLAEDIFWVDGEPALLDCLEFDDNSATSTASMTPVPSRWT
jgi:aminoglycoside phosphotransferase family enzyme